MPKKIMIPPQLYKYDGTHICVTIPRDTSVCDALARVFVLCIGKPKKKPLQKAGTRPPRTLKCVSRVAPRLHSIDEADGP